MSSDYFIPEIWAASILENFHHAAVLTTLANREYEGEAKIGNTVHIPSMVSRCICPHVSRDITRTKITMLETFKARVEIIVTTNATSCQRT
ncbi:MAG: hypothetical protein QM234_02140 [Acidobacteriota bacterium]|nr:hypothetical protein [Acidobacteriota bacterium]